MFDFINHALKEQGVNPLYNGSAKKVETNKKKVVQETSAPSRMKESELSYQELDNLVESAIKETAKNLIMESVQLEDSQKLEQTNAINRSSVGEEFTEQFMNETISPVLDICQTLTEDARLLHTVQDPSRVRGVSLPVYEVALTLESARRGALTEESMDFSIAVKEDVDPTILDLKAASAEANAKDGKVDEDEQDLSDLIDQDECETYDMGETAVKEDYDPMDIHQYEDNDDKMYELEKGKEPKQPLFDDDPDFDDESDLEEYEGDPAGDPTDDGNFPDETMPVSEGKLLAKYMFGLSEECEDPEPEFDDVEDIEEYEGEVAGEEGDGADNDDEFEGGPSSDEAIIESQILIAKKILGNIFHEYGITSQAAQRAIVNEAVHYVFRYGINNLFPATSDVASLVVEQNNIAEIDDNYSATQIVEATQPILTPLQEAEIENKSNEYLHALSTSKDMTKDKSDEDKDKDNGDTDERLEENAVMKAINFITTTSLIERTRQAFRHRLHHFNEDVKSKVASNWVLVENSTETGNQLKDEITIRRYVTEAAELKEFFGVLKEDSPVYRPAWKKAILENDSLTTACIFTEVVAQWAKLKDSLYNGQPLEYKYIALEAMGQLHEVYKNLCSAMRNPEKAKQVIENHEFRLQNLKEKVELALSKQ